MPGRASAAAKPGTSRREPLELLALPPMRAVLQLATPTTFVMLIGTATNVLYTYYVSQLGEEALAAVSLVFPVTLLISIAMGGGLGGGVASAIARALGADRRRHAVEVAEHAVAIAVGLGIAVAIVVGLGGRSIFALMGGSGHVLDLAVTFAQVIFGGGIVTYMGAILDSILRGEGNVRVPSVWSSVSLGLQILLTPVFMFWLGLELVGAAVAVIVSQAIAVAPRARYVFGGGALLRPHPWPARLRAEPLREILRVGVPASLSTIVNYLGLIVLTSVIARLGTAHLAAYGLCTRFDFLLMSFAFGFASAVLTLVGLATGARRPDLARVYIRYAGVCIVAIVAVPAIALWIAPGLWIDVFSADPGVHDVGAAYFRIVGPTYPFVAVSMVLAFAFQGIGRATVPLMWMVFRVVAVLIASLVCTEALGLGERAVFTAVAVANVASALVMVPLFLRSEAQLVRRMTEEAAAPAPAVG